MRPRLAPLPLPGLLRPCLVLPSTGPLTPLRVCAEATVYLGCLVDEREHIHDWLEIWLQTDTDASLPGQPVLNEAERASRWRDLLAALRTTVPDEIIACPWEEAPGPLLAFDRDWHPVEGEAAHCLNPGSNCLAILRHAPLSLCEYARRVESSPTDPSREMRDFLSPMADPSLRLAEAFLLKLVVLRGAMRLARDITRARGLPFLDLRPEHFGVRWRDSSTGFAALWTASVTLRSPGGAFSQTIATEASRHFLLNEPRATIYGMPSLRAPVSGSGSLRLRQVETAKDGRYVVEAALNTSERLPSEESLLALRLPLDGETLVLQARLGEARSANEYRFRSLPQALSPTQAERLGARGSATSFPEVSFACIPMHGSACDLYSWGIIGLELLLGSSQALPLLVDDFLTLGREANQAEANAESVEQVLANLPPDEWPETLRRGYILPDAQATEEAVPRALWNSTLALLLRLLTGEFSYSYRKSAADAPVETPQVVYEDPLSGLDEIIERAKSLLLMNGNWNQEIRSELEKWA